LRLGEFGELSGRRKALDRRRQRGVRVGVVRTIPATISTMLSTTSPVTAPPKISVILAAGQPSSCGPTTDRGCKRPFKEPPLTAESGGATRAALLAMRAHRGTGSSNPLPSRRRLGFGRHLRARPHQAVDAPLVGGSGLTDETDSPLEGTGFEPSVPREAAGILVISVLVCAHFSACRESSK